MARLVALRYGGESASVPGCLRDGTGTLYRLFSNKTIIPWQFACSRKVPVLRAVYLRMSITSGKNSRKRFLCGETSTAPQQRRPRAIFFWLFSVSETLEYSGTARVFDLCVCTS